MNRRNSLFILIIISVLTLVFAVSCVEQSFVLKEMLVGTWVLSEGPRDDTKLIVTEDRMQIVRVTYKTSSKETVAEMEMTTPAAWDLNPDGSVDYYYTTGVVWPCTFKNHLELQEDLETVKWTEEYTDQGYKFRFRHEFTRQSDEAEIVPGCMYEAYSGKEFSYYDFGIPETVEYSELRLYYDGRFQWDHVGDGTYEHNKSEHRIILHQQTSNLPESFVNMTLEYDSDGKITDLWMVSMDENPFTDWFGYFDHPRAY